jgi:hypothetical protein
LYLQQHAAPRVQAAQEAGDVETAQLLLARTQKTVADIISAAARASDQGPFAPVAVSSGQAGHLGPEPSSRPSLPLSYLEQQQEALANLARLFSLEAFRISAVPIAFPLEHAVATGLLAMRTPACAHNLDLKRDETGTDDRSLANDLSGLGPCAAVCPAAALRAQSCPVCGSNAEMAPFLQSLDRAGALHKVKLVGVGRDASAIVCRLTGTLLSDDNPFILLPNGTAFSQRGLEALATPDGFVSVPDTAPGAPAGATYKCELEQGRKIYLLV